MRPHHQPTAINRVLGEVVLEGEIVEMCYRPGLGAFFRPPPPARASAEDAQADGRGDFAQHEGAHRSGGSAQHEEADEPDSKPAAK